MKRVAILLSFALALGCGGPKVKPAAFPHLEALLTALSAKNPEWLERSAKALAAEESKLEPKDAAELRRIHELARAGDWEAAKKAAYAVRDASRRQ